MNEKQKERNPNRKREREREIGTFSTMGFDSFLALGSLVKSILRDLYNSNGICYPTGFISYLTSQEEVPQICRLDKQSRRKVEK